MDMIVVAAVGAVASCLVAWSARRRVNAAVEAIQNLHLEVNSRLSELIVSARAEAGAAGELRGRDKAHEERDERDNP